MLPNKDRDAREMEACTCRTTLPLQNVWMEVDGRCSSVFSGRIVNERTVLLM